MIPSSQDKPGVIIAQRLGPTGPANPRRDRNGLARTLAHELGHYLMALGGEAHSDRPDWNLMVAGGTGDHRDLDEHQAAKARDTISPTAPDKKK